MTFADAARMVCVAVRAEPSRDCPLCPRLAASATNCAARDPDWFNAPVRSFGRRATPRLLIVGLAPGLRAPTAPAGRSPATMPATCSTRRC